ncbi:MAG: hypothetical protein ACYCV7_01685 [Acidimicrobiales bacterium]
MKGLFDETIPLVVGHYAYIVVATVVVDDDESRTKEALHVVTGDRKRGFHWTDEGPKARKRMISCLIELGACAHVVVHHPTARRGQERARAAAFEELLPAVLGDGADELVIESRGAKLDARDRAVVMGALKDLGRTEVSYGWEGKSTPELCVIAQRLTFCHGKSRSAKSKMRSKRPVPNAIFPRGCHSSLQ